MGSRRRKNGVTSSPWFTTTLMLFLSLQLIPSGAQNSVPQCFGKLDIVFVLDVSVSVDMMTTRSLVNNTMKAFNKSDDVRMGVVFYEGQVFEGSTIQLTSNLQAAMATLEVFNQFSQQMSFTVSPDRVSALKRMMSMFNEMGDKDATLASVLITDSTFTDQTRTTEVVNALAETRINVLPFGFGDILIKDRIDLFKIATPHIPQDQLNSILDTLGTDGKLPDDTSSIATDLATIICEVTRTEQELNVPKANLPVDIYFALEGLSSSPSAAQNHGIMKDFVKMVAKGFVIDDGMAKVSVMNYGQQVLNDYYITLEPRSEQQLMTAISGLAYNPNNAGRNLNDAVVKIMESINANSQPERPVSIVVFSTGPLTDVAAIEKAQALKERVGPKVQIIVLGVAGSESTTWAEQRSEIASPGAALPLTTSFSMLTMTDTEIVLQRVQAVKDLIVNFATPTQETQFDLVMAVDGSARLTDFDVLLLKSLLNGLMDRYSTDIDSGNIRIGFLVYDASGVYINVGLGTYQGIVDLKDQIGGAQFIKRTQQTDNAIGIEAIRDEFQANSRQGVVSKMGLLITWGPSPYDLLVQVHARAAAEEGIQLLILGILGEMNDMKNVMEIDDSFKAFYVDQLSPLKVHFLEYLSLGSTETLDIVQGDLDLFAETSHNAGSRFPWDTPFDMIFLVHDEAGRFNMGLQTKEFLKELLLNFKIDQTTARIGVITFGNGVNREDNQMIELANIDNPGVLQAQIQYLNIEPTGGLNISTAISEMVAMFSRRNVRPDGQDVAKLAFLIAADGQPIVELPDFTKIDEEGIRMLTLEVGGDGQELIMEQLAYNPQVAYRQTAWDDLVVTERMIADINSLALNDMFESDLDKRPLSLSTICSHPAGIAIAIDTSGSIVPILEEVKRFIGILLSGFDLSAVDVGLFGYGDTVHDWTLIELGSIKNYAELYFSLLTKVTAPADSQTRTDVAINYMKDTMFSNYGKKKIAIIVTDGKSTRPDLTAQAAQSARESGIEMLTFGVDGFLNELQAITGNVEEAIFSFDNADFSNDENLKQKLEGAASYICAVSKPPENCVPGTRFDVSTGTCIECERGTYQNQYNQTICIQCHAGLTTNGTGTDSISKCYDKCADGKTWDGSECVPCGYGKYRNKSDHNLCQDCDDMFTTLTLDGTAETDMAVEMEQCAPDCLAGYEWNESEKMCVPCAENFYNPIPYQKSCLPCPTGQVSKMGSVECIAGSQLCPAAMELAVIVDNAGGITEASFNFMKSALKNVINTLDIAPGSTRVAVIPSVGQVPFALNFTDASMSQATVHAAIDSLVLSSSSLREMADPLQAATTMLKVYGRSNVPKFILMAVFGESENPIRSKYSAAFAAQNSVDVDIFTWGFGANYGSSGPALAELEFVAKDGDSSFTQPDFTTDISSSAVSDAVCDLAKKKQFTTAPLNEGLCNGPGQLDIILVLDMSGSLNTGVSSTAIAAFTLIAALQDRHPETPLIFRLGLIIYDETATKLLTLDDGSIYDNISDVLTNLLLAAAADGPATANMHLALSSAITEFTTNGNPSAQWVLITVTDGQTSDKALALEQAQLVHDNYINSLVVKLGSNTDVGSTEVIEALATHNQPILDFPSAAEWEAAEPADQLETNTLANQICQSSTAEFQCAYNVRVLMVIDLDDKELMTSALNTGAALGTASISATGITVDPEPMLADDATALGDVVTLAMNQIEETSNAGVTQVILIATDRNHPADNEDSEGLEKAIADARRRGIVIGVMNANADLATEEFWLPKASYEETYVGLEVGTQYDDHRYAPLIPQRFCLDPSVCRRAMDLVFLVDNTFSATVTVNNFDSMKTFLQNTVDRLDVSPSQVRVGVAQMSSLQFTVSPPYFFPLTFDAAVTEQNVKDTINSLALEAAPRDTASALTAVLFSLFGTSPRQDVPKVIMVLTHGTSFIPEATKLAAATVESQGVVIIPVGVGLSKPLGTPFIGELQYIATDENNFVQETFTSLQGEGPPATVSGKLCEAAKNYELRLDGACVNRLDIVFVVDSSSSLSQPEKDAIGNAVENVLNRLDIGDDKVQVFAELFDNDVTLEYTDGDGNTVSAGLGAALQKGFMTLESSPARPSLPQVMVTITATKSSNIEETKANAQTISDNKIHSIVVRLGLEPDKAEVQAVATDPGAVLTYESAADISADDLLSMICPAEGTCDSAVKIVQIWDIGDDLASKDVLVSALRLQDSLLDRYPQENMDTIFRAPDSLGAAVSTAHSQLVNPPLGTLKIIVIITNQDVNDLNALQNSSAEAKADGTVIVVLDANPSPNMIWSQIASTEEDTLQGDPLSLHNFRFIYDRLCPACLEPMDLIILVDIHQDILSDDFTAVKLFLVNLIHRLSIDPELTRVSIAGIDSQTVVPSLDAAPTKAALVNVITPLAHNANAHNVAGAVGLAREVLIQEGRENVAKTIMVVSLGGSSNTPEALILEKAETINAEIGIASLAIGAEAIDEMEDFVTKPAALFDVETMDDLPPLDLQVMRGLCDVATSFEPKTPLPDLDGSCVERADIVLLFDVSNSFQGLLLVKITLASMVTNLDIGLDKIRVAVVSFAAAVNGDNILPLDASTNQNVVMAAIDGQPESAVGGSALGLGLAAAIGEFDASQRPGVPKRLIVVTDGVYTDTVTLRESIDVLQTKAIYTVVVGIGVKSTNPGEGGAIITDPDLLTGLLTEIATEKESIVLYQAADDFMTDNSAVNSTVLAAVCPDESKVTCDKQLELVTIRDIENLDILVSALNFRDEMRTRFPSLNDQLEIDVSGTVTLPDAIVTAVTHFGQQEIIDALGNFDIASFEIQPPPPNVIRMIIIITDKTFTDPASAIRNAALAAKEVGIIVTVINAGPVSASPLSPWLEVVSSIDNLFEVDPASSWFIHKRLCPGEDCLDGSHIDVEGKCVLCEQGTYRNSTEDYQCQLCPNQRTTPSAGAVDVSDCTHCPAGMEVSGDTCAECPDGSIQPEPSDQPCLESNCPDGYIWNTTSESCNIACPVGSYKKSDEECAQCPTNTTSVSGSNNCFPTGTFRFSSETYQAQEGEPLQITVQFDSPLSAQDINAINAAYPGVLVGVTVRYQITGGTAIIGQDFILPEENTCIFPLKVFQKTLNITILADDETEDNETFTLRLDAGVPLGTSCPDGPCSVEGIGIGDPSSTIITIVDRLIQTIVPLVRFSQSSYTVLENAGSLAIGIDVMYQMPATDDPLAVVDVAKFIEGAFLFPTFNITVESTDVNASKGSDYIMNPDPFIFLIDGPTENAQPEAPSTIAAAQTVTLTDTFTKNIQIIDNNIRDRDRQFTLGLALSIPSGEFETAGNIPTAPAVIGEPSEATVTIGDNEVAEPTMTFSFGSSTVRVSATGTSASIVVKLVTVMPEGISPQVDEVSVTVSTRDGTAKAGTHYVPKSVNLTFNPESGQLSQEFTVEILGNPSSEYIYFYIDLKSNSPGTEVGLPATVKVEIAGAETGGDCDPCVDLVIAVDMSRNSAGSECGCIKKFLASLVDRLTLSKTCTRTGIIKFARSPVCVIGLQDGYTDRRVKYQIGKQMRRVSNSNNADACSAFNAMYGMLGKWRRSNVPLKGLLLMDQKSDNTARALVKANKLKGKGVDLTVIGTDAAEVAALGNVGFVITDYCNMTSIDNVVNSFC